MPVVPGLSAIPSATVTAFSSAPALQSQCTSPGKQPMISATTTLNVDLDLVREKISLMSRSEKVLRIVSFTAQHSEFPPITCQGNDQKCTKCQKNSVPKLSWIFQSSQFKEKFEVPKCQLETGMFFSFY